MSVHLCSTIRLYICIPTCLSFMDTLVEIIFQKFFIVFISLIYLYREVEMRNFERGVYFGVELGEYDGYSNTGICSCLKITFAKDLYEDTLSWCNCLAKDLILTLFFLSWSLWILLNIYFSAMFWDKFVRQIISNHSCFPELWFFQQSFREFWAHFLPYCVFDKQTCWKLNVIIKQNSKDCFFFD